MHEKRLSRGSKENHAVELQLDQTLNFTRTFLNNRLNWVRLMYGVWPGPLTVYFKVLRRNYEFTYLSGQDQNWILRARLTCVVCDQNNNDLTCKWGWPRIENLCIIISLTFKHKDQNLKSRLLHISFTSSGEMFWKYPSSKFSLCDRENRTAL